MFTIQSSSGLRLREYRFLVYNGYGVWWSRCLTHNVAGFTLSLWTKNLLLPPRGAASQWDAGDKSVTSVFGLYAEAGLYYLLVNKLQYTGPRFILPH
eukprot:574311-Prymnesium_polylepis.1